jgi:myo-inositol-1(or 4)-monophosphatase
MNREEFIKKLTISAGKKALIFFKKDKSSISLRGQSKEVVTKYDKILDKFIISQIEKFFPKDSILTEESGLMKKSKENLWIVDSLDGSSNFANQNHFFSISIAFFQNKKPILGAVFAPALDEFYFAKKRKGAFLSGKRIFVSKIKNSRESYIVYCEGAEKNRERVAKILYKIFPKVKDIRKIGSAGIETCWLAAGKIDAYFTTQIEIWDVAAGILIVKEAGGRITNFEGKNWKIERQDLLFTNRFLHQDSLRYLN